MNGSMVRRFEDTLTRELSRRLTLQLSGNYILTATFFEWQDSEENVKPWNVRTLLWNIAALVQADRQWSAAQT